MSTSVRLPFSSHTREPRRVMFNALTSVDSTQLPGRTVLRFCARSSTAAALHCRRWKRREKPQRAEGETRGEGRRGGIGGQIIQGRRRRSIRRRKERANMLVAGNPATVRVVYVQTTAITAFSLQNAPCPVKKAGKYRDRRGISNIS